MQFWSACDALCCLKHTVLALTYRRRLKPRSCLLLKVAEVLFYLEPKLLHSILSALLALTAVTGTHSGRLWTFWNWFPCTFVLCSLLFLQIATEWPSRQKSHEARGVAGKQVLLHVIEEEIENCS